MPLADISTTFRRTPEATVVISITSAAPMLSFANLNSPSFGELNTAPARSSPTAAERALTIITAGWEQSDMRFFEQCIVERVKLPDSRWPGQFGQSARWEYHLLLDNATAIVVFSLLLAAHDQSAGEEFGDFAKNAEPNITYQVTVPLAQQFFACIAHQFGGSCNHDARRARIGLTSVSDLDSALCLTINSNEPLGGIRGLMGTRPDPRVPLEIGLIAPPYINARVAPVAALASLYDVSIILPADPLGDVLGAMPEAWGAVLASAEPIWLEIPFLQAQLMFERALKLAAQFQAR